MTHVRRKDPQEVVIDKLRADLARAERKCTDVLVHCHNLQCRNDLLQSRLDEAMGRGAARQVVNEAYKLRAPAPVVEACAAMATAAEGWDIGRLLHAEPAPVEEPDYGRKVDEIVAWAARQGDSGGISRPVTPARPPKRDGAEYRAVLRNLAAIEGGPVTARALSEAMGLTTRAAECWLQRNAKRVGRAKRVGARGGRPGNLYLPRSEP